MWTTPPLPGPAMSAHLRVDRTGAVLGLALALGGRADEDGARAGVVVLVRQLVGVGGRVKAHRLPRHGANLVLLDGRVGLAALPRVGEVRADDLLLAHPQVA